MWIIHPSLHPPSERELHCPPLDETFLSQPCFCRPGLADDGRCRFPERVDRAHDQIQVFEQRVDVHPKKTEGRRLDLAVDPDQADARGGERGELELELIWAGGAGTSNAAAGEI